MRVAAIVLAAGESRRMGRQKLTLPYGESTILETVVSRLQRSPVDAITVILGRTNYESVYPVLEHLDVEVFVNPRPELGMISSAKRGLGQVRADAEWCLFV